MFDKIKLFFSRFGLLFVFTLTLFFIIMIELALIAVTGYFLTKYGQLDGEFYKNPTSGPIVVYVTSIIIVGTVVFIINKIILKPIRQMIRATNELANGNFDVRIDYNEKFSPAELKDYQKSFNTAAKELGNLELLRKDFINNFSHEFKTPIVSIGGFARLLLEGNLTKEETEDYLHIIVNESERLSVLATNVLNLSKVENQSIITNKQVFNISEQIRQIVVMLEPKWSEKNLVLDLELEEINFYGNSQLFNQVWVNILDNAIKFSSSNGDIVISGYETEELVIINIKDKGTGMDEKTADHIFDKFYQEDTSRKIGGNGLGLTIVKKIISLHNGIIQVDSVVGDGTTISIELPKETFI